MGKRYTIIYCTSEGAIRRLDNLSESDKNLYEKHVFEDYTKLEGIKELLHIDKKCYKTLENVS